MKDSAYVNLSPHVVECVKFIAESPVMEINGRVYCPMLELTVPQRDLFGDKVKFFSGEDADLALSKKLSDRAMIKECYHNCFNADVGGRYDYYEGWCFGNVLPVQHCWLVDRGHVIDPTLIMDVTLNEDTPSGHNQYHFQDRVQKADYVGVRIPRKWLNAKVLKEGRTGGFLAEYLQEQLA